MWKKNRSRLLAIVVVGLITTSCGILGGGTLASIQYSQYIGGYWGQWKTLSNWAFWGAPNEFVVYKQNKHPSDFCFRLTVNGFSYNYLNNGEQIERSGIIEYSTGMPSVNDKTTSKWFVEDDLPYLSSYSDRKTRPARVIVEKKGGRYYYHVSFDDVGFVITIPWKDSRYR